MSEQYRWMATAAFGLEGIVARELKDLHMDDVTCENGRVFFTGDAAAGARANLWLRCADRVFLVLDTFRAQTFEELFQGVRAIPWHEYVPKDGAFPIARVKSHKSKLYSLRDIQSVGKKAAVSEMKDHYGVSWFDETGIQFPAEISIMEDVVTVAVDASGRGLHKRGYRPISGEAPLRETLAAAMVRIARYRGTEPFLDPMCGTGTICLEAYMQANHIAPGLFRDFVSEKWTIYSPGQWSGLREEAKALKIENGVEIRGSDIDPKAVAVARRHAQMAGASGAIRFDVLDLRDLPKRSDRGLAMFNPPYGERLLDRKQAEQLSKEAGNVLRTKMPDWRVGVLSGLDQFPRFYGGRPDLNRKLYNGKLKCYFYLYDPARAGKQQTGKGKDRIK